MEIIRCGSKIDEYGGHYIYHCCLNNSRCTDEYEDGYNFKFTDSVFNFEKNKQPSKYDILACLDDHSYCLDSFQDFCNTFGYSIYCDCGNLNCESKKIYKAVKKETKALKHIFTEEQLQLLSEIQ